MRPSETTSAELPVGREIDLTLAEAERKGLKIAMVGRSLALSPVILWFLFFGTWPSNLYGAVIVSAFIAVGVFHHRLIGSRWERGWHRYAFITLDVAAMSSMAAFMPLSLGGDVPQIIAFRAYGVTYLFLLLAVAALSLSPGLVLWTGAAVIAGLWASFGYVVAQMERTLSWGDLPPGPSGEQYLEIFLDPDFIGIGNRIEESIFFGLSALILAYAVQRARRVVRDHALAERRRSDVAQVFGRYVPAEVAERLIAGDGELAAEAREATILFIDIQGFTARSERLGPRRTVEMLNAYFEKVAEAVTVHRGVVVSFIGDAVLAAFNAPLSEADHGRQAVAAARAILTAVGSESFADERIDVRIGLATGPVAAGTIGGGGRLSYTLYGDTVNLAQRLEQMNKSLGTRLAVTEATWQAAGRELDFKAAGEVEVRGRNEPVKIYVLDESGGQSVG